MDLQYKKRTGTSGIGGHLYETRLISLILFRLLHDDTIEDFYLGSNLDDIGAFDDICLKMKIAGRNRPVAVFVQVKHKDNDDKSLSLDNKSDAVKWSESILQIKKRITSIKSADKIFSDDFDETDYIFILYTNAKCDFVSKNKFDSNYAANLNKLMATSDSVGLQALYTEEHVNDLGGNMLETHISCLAERFAKFLSHKDNQSMNMLNDEYIQQYHLILRLKVVDVTDIQTDERKPDVKWRIMTFRKDFFDTDDKYLVLLRNHLYEHILKKQPKFEKTSDTAEKPTQDSTTTDPEIEKLISAFFANPSAVTLSALIVTHITCDANGKLVFVTERSEDDKKRLEEIDMPLSTINEAKAIAKLMLLKLKVPCAFGNIDIAISGTPKKIERRLTHLTNAIVNFCQNYTETESYKLVTIDDNIDAGILSSNGGLASGVGNILVYDENTKFLRFASDVTSLQNNAKALFLNLENKIIDLHEYRFDVKTLKFPKLGLDCSDVAREFLSNLVIYANQSNHHEVDDILRKEIQRHPSIKVNDFSGKSDLVLLYFHNEIQKWWMSPEAGLYLTKTSDIYEQTINTIEAEPQMCKMQNMFQMNNIRYLGYNFNDSAMTSFESLKNNLKIAVVTDITTLTILKVIKCLQNNDLNYSKYVVLYVDTIVNFDEVELYALDAELKKTKRAVIIVCDNIKYDFFFHIKLNELKQATKEKKVIVITNEVFIASVNRIFGCADNVIYDKTQSLADMTPESQRDVIDNSKVIFQGLEVGLDLFVDEMSVAFIKGVVFKKIIHNETISIGLPLGNSNYDEIKHLYVDRTISEQFGFLDNYHFEVTVLTGKRVIRTFNDISDNAVLITAAPGMGKSTLLTHLGIKTKELNQKFWIIRINLLEYSADFYKWQEDVTVFNTLGTLKFICQVILKNKNLAINLREINDEVFLEGCTGDEWATFELNMFLHFYNNRRLILLFDGFDEICPHYKDIVMEFLNVVRNYPQQNKIWVTSRPYSDILIDLCKHFGKHYNLDPLSDAEQKTYLQSMWKAKLKVEELTDTQLQNLLTYMSAMYRAPKYEKGPMKTYFYAIVQHFISYIVSSVPSLSMDDLDNYLDKDYYLLRRPIMNTEKNPFFIYFIYMYRDNSFDIALLGTPLLLYLVADYFVHMVHANKYDSSMNIYNIYKLIIETKLKEILLQDKNKIDIYNPYIKMKYEKELAECLAMHKKLAAYSLLWRSNNIISVLKLDEFKQMDPLNKEEFDAIIYKIKTGEEKSGFISYVTADDEPVFVHRTFTEYFTAEYLCDILTSDKIAFDVKIIFYTTLYKHLSNNLIPWIAEKCLIDTNLGNVINEIECQDVITYDNLSFKKSF